MSWQIAMNPGLRRTLAPDSAAAKAKARVRCVRLQHGSPSRSGEERAAACAASGLLEPDDCPAALVVTREKRVRNLPDRPCGGGLNRRRFSLENVHLRFPPRRKQTAAAGKGNSRSKPKKTSKSEVPYAH